MGNIRGSSFYELVTGPDWISAEAAAANLGGNLITINDASESSYITSTYMEDATNAYYIGLNSADTQGNWIWSSAESTTYTNWAPGTPNNQPSERYSIIGIITGWWDDWTNQQGDVTQGIAEVPLSYFSVSDLTVNEGDSGSITISRTGGSLSAQSLTVTSSNNTASNSDYSAINTTISFASGETSKTITFHSTEDTSTENDETVTITIEASGSDDVPAQISDGTATVTITDDDAVLPSYYSVSDTQADEGDTLLVQATRTGNLNLAHNLTLSWTNGTAFQGYDFTPPSTTVSFLAGESSKQIAIQSIEDTNVEPNEVFSITLSSSDTTALFTDDTATLTILNDDAAPTTITNVNTNSDTDNQTYLNYSSYSIDQSGSYDIRVEGNINTGGGSFVLGGDSNNVGNSATTVNSDYRYTGTAGGDRLFGSQGANGESWAHDFFDAGDGDDYIGAGGGRDVMNGGFGDDELRAGYGHDILDGGDGEDILYGGGGRNTFNNNDDGDFDQLFVLSDYHSHGYSWGRLHNGANADTISSLGEEDRITILGATTDELSIRQLNDGLGIFASGSLEAIVTDSSWSAAALGNNVFGDASRFW